MREPANEQPTAAPESDTPDSGAQRVSSWKRYDNAECGFEISYPADWEFDDNARPAYAGETRTLFGLEMDGPDQSQDGGGDFSDGAIIGVQVTGITGDREDWTLRQNTPRLFKAGRQPIG